MAASYKEVFGFVETDLLAVDPGNAWSLYFRDPEADGIEISLDTPSHVAQPHRVELDLSLSDDEIFCAAAGPRDAGQNLHLHGNLAASAGRKKASLSPVRLTGIAGFHPESATRGTRDAMAVTIS